MDYSQQYPEAAKLIDEFLLDRICEKGFKACSLPYTNQLKPIKVNELYINEGCYDRFRSAVLKKTSDSELYDILICDEISASLRQLIIFNPWKPLVVCNPSKVDIIF